MEIYEGLNLLPKNIWGWHSDTPMFCKLIKKYRPQHIIEVGSWLGASAITMGHCCKNLNLTCKITCVDTWLGSIEFIDEKDQAHCLQRKNGYPQAYFQFLSNVVHEGLQDIIVPFPNTSLIAARRFEIKGVTANLTYIDGSHDYEDVLADLTHYWPLTTKAMFGDDYDKAWPSIKKAVNKFVRERNLPLEIEGNGWIIRRPHPPVRYL